jgi:hypothetical protein
VCVCVCVCVARPGRDLGDVTTEKSEKFARFEVYTEVNIQVRVFRVVPPYSDVIGYYAASIVIEVAWPSDTSVVYHRSTRCHNPVRSSQERNSLPVVKAFRAIYMLWARFKLTKSLT